MEQDKHKMCARVRSDVCFYDFKSPNVKPDEYDGNSLEPVLNFIISSVRVLLSSGSNYLCVI